jgi:hypothetical protein
MAEIELVEIAPGRFRVKRTPQNFARSDLPLPFVISDQMEPLEQVDGKFYSSKRAFRAVGRAHGLTEVGNEKVKPKTRASDDPIVKRERRNSFERAVARYKAGERPKT